MEIEAPPDRPKIHFLTKGVAAMEDLEEVESHILEVKCFFSYQGHDLGIEKNGFMVVALTEDLKSIKDSILEQFQHLSTRPCRVTLRLLWLAGPTPPQFNSPSHGHGGSCKSPKCRTLTPSNIGPWLRHWKDVGGGKELESKNRIKAELNDGVQHEGAKAERPAAGGNHPKSRKKPETKQISTARVPKWLDLPSVPGVVPPIQGYPGREGLVPNRGASSQAQNKVHANATKRSKPREQRNAALFNGEGDVIGSKAPALGQDNKGRAMMEKMGWSEGTGLGAPNKQCNVQPILQVFKTSKAGLGISRSWDNTRHDRDLPPSDDTGVAEQIRRTEAQMREEIGDESGSDEIAPNNPISLRKADWVDGEREALTFLATLPSKPLQTTLS